MGGAENLICINFNCLLVHTGLEFFDGNFSDLFLTQIPVHKENILKSEENSAAAATLDNKE